jgi:cell division protein FtsW
VATKARIVQQDSKLVKLRDAVLSPRESFMNWYEDYFRNQSRDFKFLVGLITLMVGFGVVMVLSSSNVDSIKATGNPFQSFAAQLIFALGGLALMFFISRKSIQSIETFGLWLFLASLFMQLLVRVPGIGSAAGGNANWVGFGIFKIQPSEFIKLGLILFMAGFLSRRIDELHDWRRGLLPSLIAGFVSAGLVLGFGNDLGTAGVILVVTLAVMVTVGLPWKHITWVVASIVVIFAATTFSSPNRLARVLAFFDPSSAADSTNWQVQHGLWALASGGAFGTGLGQSKLNWGWIPEVENDFIFAIIGEEWGMIGALVVIAFFFMLFIRLFKIGAKQDDPFASIATYGVALWITIQALINIAVVLQILPVLGVPLPLISRGGSSLVSLLMGLGVVLAFERNQVESIPAKRRR